MPDILDAVYAGFLHIMIDPALDRRVGTVSVRISVCMATYNGGRFIGRQLQTILSQLSPDDEVVISDDSSTDNTLDIIESFEDSRIRLFKNQTFQSPVYNFEHALKHARGQFIFLSDQDDEWAEGWVQAALDALHHAALVVCDAYIIDAEGNTRPPTQARIYHGVRGPGIIRNLYRNGYIGCCCAFRKEVLTSALPFPAKLPWHDWWIGLVANAFYATIFIDGKFIGHRRHGGNTSSTGQGSASSLVEKFHMRWRIVASLLHRMATR